MSHGFRKVFGFVALVTTLSAALPVLAQNTQVSDGVQAFNAGNYQEALALFERAESGGNQTETLQYNIAVTLYRLGRYAEAEQRFLTLVDDRAWQVLVQYNLGLTAEAQRDETAARRYYQLAVEQEENDRVRALARQKIRNLEQAVAARANPGASTPTSRTVPKTWAALISVGAGYDSNASSLADELLESGDSSDDAFLESLLYGQHQLVGTQRDGFRVYALGFDRRFDTFDHLDSQVIGIGGLYERPWGDYQLEAGVRVNRTLLDSREVADQVQVNVAASRVFDFGTVRAGYAISHFDAGSDFDQIEGDQHQLEVAWRRQYGDFDVRARYRYEINSREDLQRGGAFASYSPDRHGIRIEGRWQATSQLSAGLVTEYVHSRYDGTNRLRDTDGQIREAGRVNRQSRVTADVTYRLNRQWRARAEYQFTDQKDNFDVYAYDKHRVMGTIEFQF